MQVQVRPLFACDAPRLRVPVDADGAARVVIGSDASLTSVHTLLFDGPVRFVDRHGVCQSLHWPLWLVAALDGSTDTPLTLFFVDVRKMRATTLQKRTTAVLRDVHLFHTPAYANAVRWIVHETVRPLVLPKQTVTRVNKDGVCDDKGEWTMVEWLRSFPRAEEDALDVVITHQDERCVLGIAGDVVFCLPHRLSEASTPTPSPVAPRKRKA
jgi:hypothetical protein